MVVCFPTEVVLVGVVNPIVVFGLCFEVFLLVLCVMLLEELLDRLRLLVEGWGLCRGTGLIYKCKLVGTLVRERCQVQLCPF